MRRIFSYNLAILFYFLQGKTLSIPYVANRIPKETLDSLFDNLESIVNSSNSAQNVFYREVENDFYIVSVKEPQRDILKDYLQKYCEELVNDRLETRNQNVLKWNYVRQEFIKRLAPLNLNCFISTNIYAMPQLAPELIKLHDNGGYDLDIKIDTANESVSEESFSFKCSLNLSGILEEPTEPKSKSKKKDPKQEAEQEKRKRTKFTRKTGKLYNHLKCKAKAGKFNFAKSDLTNNKLDITMKTLYMAVKRLNEQYQEIYDTEKILLKGDRGEGEYILEDVWRYKDFD